MSLTQQRQFFLPWNCHLKFWLSLQYIWNRGRNFKFARSANNPARYFLNFDYWKFITRICCRPQGKHSVLGHIHDYKRFPNCTLCLNSRQQIVVSPHVDNRLRSGSTNSGNLHVNCVFKLLTGKKREKLRSNSPLVTYSV